MGTKYVNQDGLTQRFGTRVTNDDSDVAFQTSTAGSVQEIEIHVPDATLLVDDDGANYPAGEYVNAAKIPDGSFILSAEISVIADVTGTATDDVLVGAYTIDAATGLLVEVDLDGFIDAGDGDVSVLLDGVTVAGTGALIGSVVVGDTVVAAVQAGTALTAGEFRVRVEYRAP
jgi:hypothetical protein